MHCRNFSVLLYKMSLAYLVTPHMDLMHLIPTASARHISSIYHPRFIPIVDVTIVSYIPFIASYTSVEYFFPSFNEFILFCQQPFFSILIILLSLSSFCTSCNVSFHAAFFHLPPSLISLFHHVSPLVYLPTLFCPHTLYCL